MKKVLAKNNDASYIFKKFFKTVRKLVEVCAGDKFVL